jgi:hypothetical protein
VGATLKETVMFVSCGGPASAYVTATVIRGARTLYSETRSFADVPDAVRLIRDLSGKFPLDEMRVETTGVGGVVADALKNNGLPVRRIN